MEIYGFPSNPAGYSPMKLDCSQPLLAVQHVQLQDKVFVSKVVSKVVSEVVSEVSRTPRLTQLD